MRSSSNFVALGGNDLITNSLDELERIPWGDIVHQYRCFRIVDQGLLEFGVAADNINVAEFDDGFLVVDCDMSSAQVVGRINRGDESIGDELKTFRGDIICIKKRMPYFQAQGSPPTLLSPEIIILPRDAPGFSIIQAVCSGPGVGIAEIP